MLKFSFLMNPLPSLEERQWLVHAVRKLVSRRDLLEAAPLVEPTNAWFPEPWAMTAAHGHRLAQRLMYYAGLGDLRISLDAYQPVWGDDEEPPWDADTAGWFAGIENGRAHFGLRVSEFRDPELAGGVLAHEVAHAWRAHHRLVVEDRDEEELLTDVTTIILGFGILATNNTDRYRSSGDSRSTSWSFSSVGYLPPQAMAYTLALWSAARDKPGEQRAIERHLEPNQLAFYRAALDECGNAREMLSVAPGPRRLTTVSPDRFAPVEPRPDEISEPPRAEEIEVNRGRIVFRKKRGDIGWLAFFGAMPGFLFGMIAALTVLGERSEIFIIAGVCAAITAALSIRSGKRDVCSECGAIVKKEVATCSGCGGTFGRRVTESELREIREEEFERLAARDVDYEDCDLCEPEKPCPTHQATARISAPFEREEEQAEEDVEYVPRPKIPNRKLRAAFAMIVAAAAIIVGVVGWRRQSQVRVYFTNALDRSLTLQVDDATFALAAEPVMRELAPGRHRIIVRDAGRELERYDADVTRQNFFAALRAPHFFVYSVAGAAIFRRAELTYARTRAEQHTEERLIALERWIEQEDADYVFAAVPAELNVGARTAKRSVFEIADATFRDVAAEWYANNRYDDALRALRKAIELTPCDETRRGDLVDFLEQRGPRDKAIDEATNWVGACNSSIEAHRRLQDLVRERDLPALTALYRERLEREPNAANHYLYGRILRGTPAIAEHREALRLDPALTWARVALAHELLEAEQDAEAYAEYGEALRAKDVPIGIAADFARAAVAVEKQDEALATLNGLLHVDARSRFDAQWILLRSKFDWGAAKVALADYESGAIRAETRILRARIEWESGVPRDEVLTGLRRDGETAYFADYLEFEDALENGRVADAAAIEQRLRVDRKPSAYSIYPVAAAMLAKDPDAAKRLQALRTELTDPTLLPLLEALEGRGDSPPNEDLAPHLWFAKAVRASATGDRAKALALFRKSAERALDRELPYRLALQLAAAHE